MSKDEDEAQQPQDETASAAPAQPTPGDGGEIPAAPWEKSGEEYDPARAAALIANLRQEIKALKEERTAQPAQGGDQDEDEAQQPQDETASAAPAHPEQGEAEQYPPANDEVHDLRMELAKTKALAASGLPLDFLPYVPGETEEQVSAAVQFLAEKFAGPSTPTKRAPVDPAQTARAAKDPYEEIAAALFK